MVFRKSYKCDVCKSTIQMKFQIGFLPKHPIRVYCKKCNVLISGMLYQNQEDITFKINLENCSEVEATTEIDYYVEISGELLTSKIVDYDDSLINNFFSPITPFIKAVLRSQETIEDFQRNTLQFLHFIDNDWPFLRRIHELWLNGNHQYLQMQMREYLPTEQFPLNNELEYLRGLHQLFLMTFDPVAPIDFHEITTKTFFREFSNLLNDDNDEFVKMVKWFNEQGYIQNYEKNIFKIICEFIEVYQFLIIAYGLRQNGHSPNLDKEGTSVVSFDDVKHFYQDCYECIGEIFPLVVAYNNIRYRKSYVKMDTLAEYPETNKINDIQKLIKQTKANRLKFGETTEVFNTLIRLNADAQQRNVIGHLECYEYDGLKQIISYYPTCVIGKVDRKNMYLVEFLQNILSLFETIFILNEFVYQTKKAKFSLEGIKGVHPSVFFK